MVNITIRNIPEELHERLKQMAKEHQRSLNSEILVLLENELKPKVYVYDENSMEVREELVSEIREKFNGYGLSNEEINKYKREGRA